MQNSVLFFQALVSNVLRYARFIPKLAHGVHKVSISPKFTTPKLLFYLRMLFEYLSCSQTFHCRYDLGRALRWNTLYQEMNMVFVNSDFQKENIVPFRYFKTDIFQAFINFLAEYNSAIFCRTYKMIQQHRNIMRPMNVLAFAHTLKIQFSPQAAGN